MKQRNRHQMEQSQMPFWGHLEVMRWMLIRLISVIALCATVLFFFRQGLFDVLLAPSSCEFITYRWIEQVSGYHFSPFTIHLITTELSSQFMTHITASIYVAVLACSPYIVFELFRFIQPALYERERYYSVRMVLAVYVLFVCGVLLNYFVLYPLSVRFLGTYQVTPAVTPNITLDSYLESMMCMTLTMGLVFQLPVMVFLLAKTGLIDHRLMQRYRRHALVLIMVLAAIITPPDLMTLFVVTVPLYCLYELSIGIAWWVCRARA